MIFTLFEEDLKHIWGKANHCLAALSHSKIFITGGTGFFGHWLLESLGYANEFLGTNSEVVVLTRNIKLFLAKSPQFSGLPWLRFLEGNIIDFHFPAERFTHVIHAAPNVNSSKRVLEFAIYAGAEQFLFTSSGAVLDPLKSSSIYGIGKLAAEHLAILYSERYPLKVKLARCFAFVGPYLPLTEQFAIGNFIHSAINNNCIYISGDGSPYRSYLYAADLSVWLWTILCFGKSGRTYNVGSKHPVNIAKLADMIANLSQPKLSISLAKKCDPNVPAEWYIPDTQRAEAELKLQQWIDLPTSIQRTIDWHKGRV